MIQAEFTAKDGSITVKIHGHAGYDEEGQDVVCAAASMLEEMCWKYTNILNENGKLQEAPALKREDGETEITLLPKAENYPIVVYTFSAFGLGFDSLAKSYEDYVAFTPFGKSI